MTTYTIYLNNKLIATLSSIEAAYEAYSITRKLAETLGYTCCLVCDETSEVIADTGEEEDYKEPDDIDDDFGFDPYEGYYTYDC